MSDPNCEGVETLPLSKAALLLLEECRMVLPGLQALFGFQLIAVFNNRFAQWLSPVEQKLHLAAIALVVMAIALIMTPAAYHRQQGARVVTGRFIVLSTRLLLCSMPALALSLCTEFYLVGRIIVGPRTSALVTLPLGLLVFVLWFVIPRIGKRNPRMVRRTQEV